MMWSASIASVPDRRVRIDQDPAPRKKSALTEIEMWDRHVKFVCHQYGITVKDFYSKRRFEKNVFPRHIAVKVWKDEIGCTWTGLAARFGRDHSTIINDYKKGTDLTQTVKMHRDKASLILENLKQLKYSSSV